MPCRWPAPVWGPTPPATVRRQLDRARSALEEVEAEHEALSRWIFLLGRHLARAEDAQARAEASAITCDDDSLVQLQGWLPRRELPRLEAFAAGRGLAWLAQTPNPAMHPHPAGQPTGPQRRPGPGDLLRNPAYRDWDPSVLVFSPSRCSSR